MGCVVERARLSNFLLLMGILQKINNLFAKKQKIDKEIANLQKSGYILADQVLWILIS